MKRPQLALSIVLFICSALFAGNAVVSDSLVLDPPTIENLGFRWHISGDDDGDAKVTIQYRKVGGTSWENAMNLLRVHNEVANKVYGPVVLGNLFAGSVLGLLPDTEYEVQFTMTDPDGGAPTPKTIRQRTMPASPVYGAGRHLHVYPNDAKVDASTERYKFNSVAGAVAQSQTSSVIG